MRKPRDFDAELKALNQKAQTLRTRKVHQLGELVIATAADALPVELLAGALLAAVDSSDAATKEGWRKRGAAFFQRASHFAATTAADGASGAAQNDGGASPDRG
uniref:conjugal transfer protein TraD n=1 Tax=uncultured Sphingomonas sp. TaxID=158754 RepID=UPI0035CA82A9